MITATLPVANRHQLSTLEGDIGHLGTALMQRLYAHGARGHTTDTVPLDSCNLTRHIPGSIADLYGWDILTF